LGGRGEGAKIKGTASHTVVQKFRGEAAGQLHGISEGQQAARSA